MKSLLAFFQKFGTKTQGGAKAFVGAIVVLFVVASVAGTAGYWYMSRGHHSLPAATAAAAPETHAFHFPSFGQVLAGFTQKVDELRGADEDARRLRLENANLRFKLESVQFDCHAQDAAKATHDFEAKLDQETGTRMGRSMAGISYKVPQHLLPAQLYTLGMSYFKAREDEKVAVIFTLLTGMEDDDAFRTAKNYLLTGISWYRLDNLAAADRYFDKALKHHELEEFPVLKSQVRLWKALVAGRAGKRPESQKWLREVLNLDPHSTEAKWVNQLREGTRGVASHK